MNPENQLHEGEDLNRAYAFMLVGMLSLGVLAGACGTVCLLALLVEKW